MYLVYCGLLLLLSFTGDVSAQGSSFAFGFMDITPEKEVDELGFVQLFAVSTNVTTLLAQATGFSAIKKLNGPQRVWLNLTGNSADLELTQKLNATVREYNSELGALLSASSNGDVHVFGVKSDKGTTDGFMALPLTEQSDEFFLSVWNCSHKEYFGAFQIVSPFEDTCIEIYEVDGDKYTKVQDVYLYRQFETYTYTSPFGTDLSGYFINSSRPIAVYAGHACAFVPDVPQTFFCDHIVEQIPPVSELGKLHIVPPIIGRDPDAGYVVRVVSAHKETKVDWVTANGATKGSRMLSRGHHFDIRNLLASQPMKVECDQPCLVMLYNTGRNTVPNRPDPVATDPFMMLVTAEAHFDADTGFATASFCEIKNNVQIRQDFTNQLAIVTRTKYISDIMVDGQAVPVPWATASDWGFSYVAFPVTHDVHFVTIKPGSSAKYGAYVYGHSIIDTSSSGYGYAIGFHVGGTPVTILWEKAESELKKAEEATLSSDCKQERILSGSAVAQHPSAASPQVLKHTIVLGVTVNSVPLTAVCRERYRIALAADFENLSRLINELICNGTMCKYMSGAPGTGIRVNESAVINGHSVFVAIDTTSLADAVSFDVVASTGAISTIHVKVPYTGIMDTTAETFAKCRSEVRKFVRQFTNWPRSTALLPTIAGCPSVTFTAPYEFYQRQPVCALT